MFSRTVDLPCPVRPATIISSPGLAPTSTFLNVPHPRSFWPNDARTCFRRSPTETGFGSVIAFVSNMSPPIAAFHAPLAHPVPHVTKTDSALPPAGPTRHYRFHTADAPRRTAERRVGNRLGRT